MSKTWFITGASRGLGVDIAKAALAAGDRVVATGRQRSQVADSLGPDSDRLLSLALDVTDAGQAQTAVAEAVARFGGIDVLVNNAGYGHLGYFEETTPDDVEAQFATNVFGLLNVTRAALPSMRERRRGHVVNISSVGGYRSGAGFGVYCSTKFAVEGISEALHAELAPLGVHVTVVEPGYFRTEFLDQSSLTVSPRILADYAATSGQVRERAVQINQKQPGDPKRLAQAMLVLVASPTPPLRLPLGTDTLQAIADKNAAVADETAAWRELSASTDFPAGE